MYLGNPEDLRDGVGDIFAQVKKMPIPNIETVFDSDLKSEYDLKPLFESEQKSDADSEYRNRSKFEIFKNNDFSTSADLT